MSDLPPNNPAASTTPLMPRELIAGAAIFYGIVIVATIGMDPPIKGDWSDTFKALGVAIAAATGVFAPISAIVMARYQSQITADLERLKLSYNKEIESLKMSLSTNLEVKKALIAGRVRAFDTMLTAAHFFYFVLRNLAYSVNCEAEELFAEADHRAAEASSVVWHLVQDDRETWFEVYQRSITLASDIKDAQPDQRITTFDANV